MLASRVRILQDFVQKVTENKLQPDYSLLRQIKSICLRLECLTQGEMNRALVEDEKNVLLVSYLSALVKNVDQMSTSLDHFQSVYSKPSDSGMSSRKMRGMLSR